MTIAIRHCQDVDERLVGHRAKCGRRFEILPEPHKLAWRWVCGCGYEGWMGLSNVKAGKFGHWFDVNLSNQIQSMEMKVNGFLVVDEGVEL